jgi:hypothetical protein
MATLHPDYLQKFVKFLRDGSFSMLDERLPLRDHIRRVSSDQLTMRFEKKFRGKGSSLGTDDSSDFLATLSLSDELIDGFYIIGAYPWQYTSEARVLYSVPCDDPTAAGWGNLVLPDGCNFSLRSFNGSSGLFRLLYHMESINNGQFLVSYVAAQKSYLFSYRLTVTALSLPALAHTLCLSDLLQHIAASEIPTCDICIVISSRRPHYTLFRELIRWFLHAELVARMAVFATIDRYHLTEELPSEDPNRTWPSAHRCSLEEDLLGFFSVPAPEAGRELVIDNPPAPTFRWICPAYEDGCEHFPLAQAALYDLVRSTSPRVFVQLITALWLETSIIVYHPDESRVANVILALHYLLLPLVWVSGSISVLPPDLSDMLYAPSPVLIGTAHVVEFIQEHWVFVDLTKGKIFFGSAEPVTHPAMRQLEQTARMSWRTIRGPDSPGILDLLHLSNLEVDRLLTPLPTSIITDFSDAEDIQSHFFEELYLSQFPFAERLFVEAFAATQMFRWRAEQECRRKTDRNSVE